MKPAGARPHPLLVEEPGHVEILIGNEAIVRGALEAGVAFASGYPGTPSSEITDSFAALAGERGLVFEYSVNEKIAVETAFGASLAGARSICAMKHLGLMYAGDPISTMPYIGAVGGMVMVSAGDPSCRTSPNEQDQRHLARMLHTPLLDPSTPSEAHAMARFAFELSEESQLPVILRPTTRVCHSRGPVTYGELGEVINTGFVRDPRRFNPVPINARRLRLEIEDRLERAAALIEKTSFLRAEGAGPLAICASGAPAATCVDLIRELGLQEQVRLITVGALHPLPEGRLIALLSEVERVLVVEELSPYLEDALLAMKGAGKISPLILGKRTGHLPIPGEYEPPLIQDALYDALALGRPVPAARQVPEVPPRPPVLCAGCSHRTSYFALNCAFGPEVLRFNDIGCYTLGGGPPLLSSDALLCMGASITLAAGASRATGQRTVAFIGDSTFFHSGIPPLINAVKEDVSMVVVVLDNQVTAMTGFQQSPTVELEAGVPVRRLSIEDAVRGLGVTQVEKIEPDDLPRAIAAFERARDAAGVSVVISERPCCTFLMKVAGPSDSTPYTIDHDRCQRCGRDSCQARCDVPLTRGYQHHIARARSLEDGRDAPLPEVAPCSARCPLHLCIQGYAGHIAAGEYAEALRHIMRHNPLPETVCRVCDHPCEDVCVRRELDEPVAINDLKRFVVDWAARQEAFPYAPEPEPAHGKSVAIIGAGPAGLAAAHDLRLRGFDVTIFDAADEPGGLLRGGIPDFRLPPEALERDLARIMSLGIAFEGRRILGRDLSLSSLLDEGFDAVFVAVGAHHGMTLDLPDEAEAADAREGPPCMVDALAYLAAGDGATTGDRVLVIGGGNAAIDAARTARRRGAAQVVIVYRRRREEMPAIAAEIVAAEEEGIALSTQLAPVKIIRAPTPGLQCLRTAPGEPDASGRQRPVPVEGSELLVEADQIILAIGQTPRPDLQAPGDLKLKLHADRCFRIDEDTGQTSHPKIFAGGDATWGDRTVTRAMASGLRSAWAIDRSLRGADLADRNLPPPLPSTPAPTGQHRTLESPRRRPEHLSPRERIASFDEVAAPLSEEAARAEAARCLVCGQCGNCRSCIDLFGCPAFYVEKDRINIDAALCTGCGVCAAFCPNGAIRRLEEPHG